MASATTHLLKPLSMAISTTLFTPKASSYPLISITPKPIKLTHLSSSRLFPQFTTHKPSIVTFVAQYAEETAENDGDGAFPEPDEEAKLFVGNLPFDIDEQQLAQIFDEAGTVEIAEVIYNRETSRSRGFGFVTMSTVEEAEKAVEKFNGYDVDGRFLTVNKAGPKGTRPERPPRAYEPSFRIYVGNLPWQIDDARLEQVFSEHGKVVNAKVVFDRETGRSRGFGFVTFSSETELDDAIAALDGQSLDGRSIRVNRAEERPRRNNF